MIILYIIPYIIYMQNVMHLEDQSNNTHYIIYYTIDMNKYNSYT